MSIHRYAAKRDENEPDICRRFATHGWHTEQLSGAGMPDLLCWASLTVRGGMRLMAFLVDVKMPGKGVTTAQVKKWTALSEKGIPVYVASTEADVDAIVGGTAMPWDNGRAEAVAKMKRGVASGPGARRKSRCAKHGCRKLLPCAEHSHHLLNDVASAEPTAWVPTRGGPFTPPRSTPVDASALAAETFAPCSCTREQPCAACSMVPPRCAVPSCIHPVPCPRHSLSALGRT